MSRKARIDEPGLVQYVFMKSFDKKVLFSRACDYREFINRLCALKDDAEIYAWTLLPDQAHFLVKIGKTKLSCIMRRLLTGYAKYFNHQKHHTGPIFKDRYHSLICSQNNVLRVLRYIHCLPLQLKTIRNLQQLANYPWCGHGVLAGKRRNSWQNLEEIGRRFAKPRQLAREKYQWFMEQGMNLFAAHACEKGDGQWEGLKLLLPKNKPVKYELADNRIYGTSDFIFRVLGCVDEQKKEMLSLREKYPWEEMVAVVCRHYQIDCADLRMNIKLPAVTHAREACTYLGICLAGLSCQEVAGRLHKTKSAVSMAFYRARAWIGKDHLLLHALAYPEIEHRPRIAFDNAKHLL